MDGGEQMPNMLEITALAKILCEGRKGHRCRLLHAPDRVCARNTCLVFPILEKALIDAEAELAVLDGYFTAASSSRQA